MSASESTSQSDGGGSEPVVQSPGEGEHPEDQDLGPSPVAIPNVSMHIVREMLS